jgi:predicted aminopeptidase
MQEYPPYSLASLMIHEQTHATVFIKNNVQFNEEFASFVGQEGALRFIEHKYGKNSKELKEAKIQIKDSKAFNAFFRNLYNDLANMYKNTPSKEERLSQKQSIIEKYKQNFIKDNSKYFSSNRYLGFAKREWNNAMIMGFMYYVEKENIFYDLLKKNNNDLKETVSQIKSRN